jgi:hypothetical protein
VASKAFFFSDDEYVRYDLEADKIDEGFPRPIQGNWPGMPFPRIDAAVVWNNGKAYFFSGDQYVSFDVAANKVDDGYPLPIKDEWKFGSSFDQRIDAAVMWKKGEALFFNGGEYVPWDVLRNGVTNRPMPIERHYWVQRREPIEIDAAVVWPPSAGGKLP